MEEYIREAPRMVSVPKPLEFPERLLLTYHPEEVPSTTDEPTPSVNEPNTLPADEISPNIEPAPPSNLDGGDLLDSGDLLGLNSNGYHDASAIEDANALALAIVPSDGSTLDSSLGGSKEMDPSGWELVLVTTPSSNISSVNDRQLVCGRDWKGRVRALGSGISKTKLNASAPYRESAEREKRKNENLEVKLKVCMQRIDEETRARMLVEERVASLINYSTDSGNASQERRPSLSTCSGSSIPSTRCLVKNFKRKSVALGNVCADVTPSEDTYSVRIDDVFFIGLDLGYEFFYLFFG